MKLQHRYQKAVVAGLMIGTLSFSAVSVAGLVQPQVAFAKYELSPGFAQESYSFEVPLGLEKYTLPQMELKPELSGITGWAYATDASTNTIDDAWPELNNHMQVSTLFGDSTKVKLVLTNTSDFAGKSVQGDLLLQSEAALKQVTTTINLSTRAAVAPKIVPVNEGNTLEFNEGDTELTQTFELVGDFDEAYNYSVSSTAENVTISDFDLATKTFTIHISSPVEGPVELVLNKQKDGSDTVAADSYSFRLKKKTAATETETPAATEPAKETAVKDTKAAAPKAEKTALP